jgi:hypothetical protein
VSIVGVSSEIRSERLSNTNSKRYLETTHLSAFYSYASTNEMSYFVASCSIIDNIYYIHVTTALLPADRVRCSGHQTLPAAVH